MPRLADRSRLPPGGLRYYCAETNWFPTPHASFDETVRQIVEHRQKNRHLAERHGWSLDPKDVAIELDAYNAKVCEEMNWREYITDGLPGDSSTPFKRFAKFVRNTITGIKTINEWDISTGRVVSQEQAEARARICARRPDGKPCPKNVQAGLLDFFTVEAANLIKLQLEAKSNRKLATSLDSELGICDACGCINTLKVWCPKDIVDLMKPEQRERLDPLCWVLTNEQEPVLPDS